ncbi:MAG: septum formation inhibitor Maf [Candidatus Competibacter sp.]|nr:septum formation inhibitor Maf [Candidatus Competibacter sp.]MDG4605519.1 Maf family protein [Candidatus Contendobacter sp.]HRD48983.1 Maf family protein [Candidatus Contendobacter sp.]
MTEILPGGRRLVLASTSPFRRELLARLGLPFAVQAPDTDESRLPGEDAPTLVARLAQRKAQAVVRHDPMALIIGSDQVAVLDDEIIGKPGHHERAVAQLQRASGRTVIFYTGLCLLDRASGQQQIAVEPFRVLFRQLTPEMIENYLRREQPYHCAGSFKSEGLGIALFERLEGDDPSSLIGLPLIQLTRMLEAAGVKVL